MNSSDTRIRSVCVDCSAYTLQEYCIILMMQCVLASHAHKPSVETRMWRPGGGCSCGCERARARLQRVCAEGLQSLVFTACELAERMLHQTDAFLWESRYVWAEVFRNFAGLRVANAVTTLSHVRLYQSARRRLGHGLPREVQLRARKVGRRRTSLARVASNEHVGRF